MTEHKTGVVIVTHGDAAFSMVEATERMVGKLDVKTISVRIGEDRADEAQRIGDEDPIG